MSSVHQDAPLAGKVALVTGGGSGIGRATAAALAQSGAAVMIVDADGDSSSATEAILAAGRQAAFLRADVTDPQAVQTAVDTVIRSWGRLDLAVNSAGVAQREFLPLASLDDAEFGRVMEVNVRGVWNCMRSEIPAMLQTGGGSIVNLTSVAGLNLTPGNSAYSASKHAVIGLTKGAAIDYAKDGIRVNAVAPGGVRTPMNEPFLAGGGEAEMVKAIPIGRIAEPSEIAETILWLSSDAASYVTGIVVPVDGAYTVP